jgi:hypothetical protein
MTLPDNPPVYNSQIPIVNTTIAEAQKLFLNNFSTLFDAFSVNHIALNDPTNPGNHNVVQLLEQELSESTQSQEISIYSKKVDGQTDQLFMRYQGNGKEFQLTEYQIYAIPVTTQQEAYFTFLPGKLIVYFGRIFSFGTNEFNINIDPAPKTNLSGLNLCPVASAIGFNVPQPNVRLQQPSNGFYTQFILNSSPKPMLDNFYLFFGNL